MATILSRKHSRFGANRVAPILTIALLAISACTTRDVVESDHLVKSPGVTITVFKELEDGKPYATVLYENFGVDTISRIKYELYTQTGNKFDTVINEIDPPRLLRPKDRHSLPRHIGEDTVTWDEAHVGQIWVVKE